MRVAWAREEIQSVDNSSTQDDQGGFSFKFQKAKKKKIVAYRDSKLKKDEHLTRLSICMTAAGGRFAHHIQVPPDCSPLPQRGGYLLNQRQLRWNDGFLLTMEGEKNRPS